MLPQLQALAQGGFASRLWDGELLKLGQRGPAGPARPVPQRGQPDALPQPERIALVRHPSTGESLPAVDRVARLLGLL